MVWALIAARTQPLATHAMGRYADTCQGDSGVSFRKMGSIGAIAAIASAAAATAGWGAQTPHLPLGTPSVGAPPSVSAPVVNPAIAPDRAVEPVVLTGS